MDMDRDFFFFLFHNVIFPPKLPQAREPDTPRLEARLLAMVEDVLVSFVEKSPSEHQPRLQPALRMLKNWMEVEDQGTLPKSSLETSLENLSSTAVVAFLLTAQNCGWMATFDHDQNIVIFDAFEASPLGEGVFKEPGSLQRHFPGVSVAIPAERFADPAFRSYLASNLSQLAMEEDPKAVLQNRSVVTAPEHSRDTAHPGLVTEGLMTQLLALGKHHEGHRIIKFIRDDVIRGDCRQPWRRSPMWLTLRVTLQLIFERSFPAPQGRIIYKNFMLYLLASFGCSASHHKGPEVHVDHLAIIRAKVGRRSYKIQGCIFAFVDDYVHATMNGFVDGLESIQKGVIDSDIMAIPHIPHSASSHDVRISLESSTKYLRDAISYSPQQPRGKDFNPTHRRRKKSGDLGLPTLQDGSLTSLADFEKWVAEELASWLQKTKPSVPVSCKLSKLLEEYGRFAQAAYANNPRELSGMILVMLELWVALDQACIFLHPLLEVFSPEIPEDFLEPLLLPQLDQMQRTANVEEYIRVRHEGTNDQNPSIFSDPQSRAFAVQYFDGSREHQRLLSKIKQSAATARIEKKKEWEEKSLQYRNLSEASEQSEHRYTWSKNGKKSHAKGSCTKCTLKTKMANLSIDVHEWPLPTDSNMQKAVVFELRAPEWFLSWRDATWMLLHDTGMRETRVAGNLHLKLLDSKATKEFAIRHEQRLSLGSTTKPWAQRHYNALPLPIPDFNSLCPESGLNFRLLDSSKRAWVTDQNTEPTVKGQCTFTLPPGPYSILQDTVDSCGRTQNEIMARQHTCDPKLSLDEFIAFGCLRAGERVQWHNILRELESSALSFNTESVARLVHQAAWQLGKHCPSTPRREAHRIFEDPGFGDQLLKTLDGKLATIESNWNAHCSLDTIVTIGLRILSLSKGAPSVGQVVSFLRRCREVASKWFEQLNEDLYRHAGLESKRCQHLLLRIAAICQATYDVECRHMAAMLQDPQDLSCLIRSSVILRENSPPELDALPCDIRATLISVEKVRHRLEKRMLDLITKDPSGMNDAIQKSGSSLKMTGSWTENSEDKRWLQNHTKTTIEDEKQAVRYNPLTGELLVDSQPPGRLPKEVLADPLYKRLFGSRTIPVVPSKVLGLPYLSAQKIHEYDVYFAMRDGQLLLRAKKDSQTFQLIPHHVMRPDLPTSFSTDFFHWFDLDKQDLEFRPLDQPWKSCSQNWQLSFSPDSSRGSLMRQGNRMLVDIRSELFHSVAEVLQTLDAKEHIHVIQNESQALEAEMTRLRLKFTVGQDGLMESKDLNARIDKNQNIGCFYGLKNKLVLLEGDLLNRRAVIVPYGHPHIIEKEKHVQIVIHLPDEPRLKYFHYSLDEHLQILRGPPDMLGSVYQAYLHAISTFPLADPALGHSGTEEAFRILRQASLKSGFPLGPDCISVLCKIASLTPRRDYYPPGLKVSQNVKWNERLGQLSQHDDFQLVANEIHDYAKRFLKFHDEDSGPDSALFRGSPLLLKRAQCRHALFRSAGFGGAATNLPASSLYTSRDTNTETSRSQQVYEIAALVRDWPSSLNHASDLLDIMKTENLVQTTGTLSEKTSFLGLFDLSVGKAWGPLYNFCRSIDRTQESYRLMSTFCTFAFRGNIDPALIRLFLIVAFSGQFTDLAIPTRPDSDCYPSLNLGDGDLFNAAQIAKAIEDSYDGFAPETNAQRYSKKASKERKQQLEEWKEQRAKDVQLCCSEVRKQWPCKKPKLPPRDDIPRVNRKEAAHICQVICTNWIHNGEFLVFLRQVEERLTHLQSEHVGVEPYPAVQYTPQARSYPMSQSLSLVELTCRCTPMREPVEPAPFSYHGSPHRVEVVAELHDLIETFKCSRKDGHRRYGEYLSESLKALANTPQCPPTATSGSEADLSLTDARQLCLGQIRRYEDDLKKERSSIWYDIDSALRSTDCSWTEICDVIWPSITVPSVLSLLSHRNWGRIQSLEWKNVLLSFARVISDLRRAERLMGHLDSNDLDEFLKEAENIGHNGWHSGDNPDWLLLEIENNITIRKGQAEVAFQMIKPETETNALLQLNMGEGKTSVITPMVASALADGKQLVRIIVLKPLLRQSINLLSQRLGGLLDRAVYHIPFTRNTPINATTLNRLDSIYQQCRLQKGILIALPEHILSFRLVGLESAETKPALAKQLISVERWLQSNCRDVIDESDEILDTRFQLVYTVGVQKSLDGHNVRWEVIQGLLGLVEAQARRLQNDDPSSVDIEKSGYRYPIFRFLKVHAIDTLLTYLLEEMSQNGLPGIPFDQWSSQSRGSARRFIYKQTVAPEDEKTVRDTFSHGIFLQKLLVLRGFFAHGILKFTLTRKRWLVDYGLHPSRCSMAVPYRAKGVPSDNAEFGHADVAITLTCLSYYYEGLTLGQLLECFTRLGKENDPSIIFQNWISRCAHELPDGLRAFTGVNIEDSRAFENLIYPLLRFQREVINFYLSQSVFPKAAKEFPRKLTTSAWDIPSQSGKQRTTGFSGTNDNRFLLPHSIHQCDLPQLLHTNAMVLGLLLRENNRQCVLAQDENGGHLNVDQLLGTICRDCNARVLIDVGAQILEYRNQSVAQRWLSMTSESEIEAAIFFNNEDEVMVVDRQGHIEPLFSSLFRQRMNACLVFLDQEHSRGVDLKLPCDARAAVILGPRLTKDRLVQACNRMRKLDKNQSVVFLVPPEVSHSMQALFNTESLEGFTSVHVLQWTMTQTCLSLDNLRPLWINHGLQYHRRMQLWRSLTSQHNFRPGILTRVQEPEARTLAELYAPWVRPSTPSAQSNPGWDTNNPQVKELLEERKLGTDPGISYCSLHEEQEREVECEIEREQQVCRPPPHLPREHILDENVKHFAKFGKAKSGGSSTAIQRAFMSMQNTSIGGTTFPHCLGSKLWVTKDFIATVQLKKRDLNDEFMKPVNWVLSSIHSDDMVIVSQHEANELLPVIRKLPYSRLHLYRPRTTNTMRSFRNLDLFTTGAGAANYQPPEDATRDLELFAGSLYFVSFDDYKRFRSFLGLATDDVDKIPEENLSNDGFVDEWVRRLMEWPVFSPFVDNPLPFLRVLMDIRTRGHKYEQTHMGSIVGARPLTKHNF